MVSATSALEEVNTELSRLAVDASLTPGQQGDAFRIFFKASQRYGGTCSSGVRDSLLADAQALSTLPGAGGFAAKINRTEADVDAVTPPS